VLVSVVVTAITDPSSAVAYEIPEQWQSSDINGLIAQAEVLSATEDKDIGTLVRLAEYAASRILADDALARSLDCDNWNRILTSLGKYLPVTERAILTERVQSLFIDKELTGQQFVSLISAMRTIAKRGQLCEFVAQYFKRHPAWRSWSLDRLRIVAGSYLHSPSREVREIRLEVGKHVY